MYVRMSVKFTLNGCWRYDTMSFEDDMNDTPNEVQNAPSILNKVS